MPTGNAFSVNISLDSGFPLSRLEALYHDLHIEKSAQRHQIRLQDSRAAMASDFVLQWAPRPTHQPQAAVFTERVAGDDYAMLMVLPPHQTKASAKIPRDIIFIIDTSGSMSGPSIEQAKQSLALAIEQLTPEDRFNIIAFESNTQALYNDLTVANREALDYAKHWIKNLAANGGTEMLPALKAAFNHSDDKQRLQQIVFMTDGAVSNEKELFSEIHTSLGHARLFTVGIGSAPNHFFMRKAAQFGRGTFTTIGDVKEVAHKTHALFKKLDSATYRDIHIDWQTHAEQYPKKVGELYAGEALLVASRLSSRPKKIDITGHSALGPWHTTINLDDASNNSPGIASHWARQKIAQLEDLGVTGAIDETALKSQVVSIALKHQLMSRFTSFIAIEPLTPSASDAGLITQQKPTLKNVPYPQTGTWSNFAWWTGILCFMGYLLMHAIRHEP
ncbi:MAG TPA: VWA domain-containing protein [Marinagarivorans sp.]